MCRKGSDVYKKCPAFENERFILRFTELSDCDDLLKVYSDIKAVPFFNSDNCGGDDFHYTTRERITEAIKYWHWEYRRKGFVRWSVIDRISNKAIGTIELFRRKADDFFTDCGLLRLDLRSDYEKSDIIETILSLITSPTFAMFNCNKIATKAVKAAEERRKALENCGFVISNESLIGHDGTQYSDYYVMPVE